MVLRGHVGQSHRLACPLREGPPPLAGGGGGAPVCSQWQLPAAQGEPGAQILAWELLCSWAQVHYLLRHDKPALLQEGTGLQDYESRGVLAQPSLLSRAGEVNYSCGPR